MNLPLTSIFLSFLPLNCRTSADIARETQFLITYYDISHFQLSLFMFLQDKDHDYYKSSFYRGEAASDLYRDIASEQDVEVLSLSYVYLHATVII